jgi:hypothetical protein
MAEDRRLTTDDGPPATVRLSSAWLRASASGPSAVLPSSAWLRASASGPSTVCRPPLSVVSRRSYVHRPPTENAGQRPVFVLRSAHLTASDIRKDITSPQLHTSSNLPSARFDTPSIESTEFIACEASATDASASGAPDCRQCILVHSKSAQFRAQQREPQAAIPQTAQV